MPNSDRGDPRRNRHLDALAPAVRSLVRRRIDEHAERQATLGAVLGEVLDDVDAAADGACACGCGTPITDSSPSAYYASAECQQIWMTRHADNPQEVYRRSDAAEYPRLDSGVQTLTEPDTEPDTETDVDQAAPRRWRRTESRTVPCTVHGDRGDHDGGHGGHIHVFFTDPPATRRLVYGPGRFDEVLAYRCTCPNCDVFMEPRIYHVDSPGLRMFDLDYHSYSGMLLQQECSACDAAMLGVIHFPVVLPSEDLDGQVLELHTAYGRVRSTVTNLALARMGGDERRRAYIAETWASMERDLARFEREWRGRLARCETVMDEWATGWPPTSDEIVGHILRDPLA
jgi:hypothetical protein